MTVAARIPQSVIERALRAAMRVGGPQARVIIDHANSRLEIVPSGDVPPAPVTGEQWGDDDV